jgi:hypothetical protein
LREVFAFAGRLRKACKTRVVQAHEAARIAQLAVEMASPALSR